MKNNILSTTRHPLSVDTMLLLIRIVAGLSFGIACTMVVATYVHMIVNGDPFVSFTGGGSYDHALIFMVIAITLFVMGPGRFSLDRLLFGNKHLKK